MIRTVVVCPYVPWPPDHGGRIRSLLAIDALDELGEVVVVAPVAGDEDRRLADALAAARGVEVVPVPAASGAVTIGAKLGAWVRGRSELLARRWSSAGKRGVAAALAERNHDLVVAETSFVLPALDASTLRAPLLLNLHNVESAILARPTDARAGTVEQLQRAVEARVMARAEARWAKRAACSVCVSSVDAELLRLLAPAARIEVVENSVDLDRLPVLPPPDAAAAPLLLFVGSFVYPPNLEAAHELVREHWPALRERIPELRLRLVGADPSGDVARLAAASGVEAVGYVDDLVDEYRAATAVYVPLRNGGGTRIKVLEAFALGRPVVASTVAVEGLPLELGVHRLSCETPAAGVESVTELLAEPARSSALVTAGRDLVESRFAHAVTRASYVDVARALVRETTRAT